MLKYKEPNVEIVFISDAFIDTIQVSEVGGGGGFEYQSLDDLRVDSINN